MTDMMTNMITDNRKPWTNWSGSVLTHPHHIAYPASIEEVVALIHQCASDGKYIRMVGSGHSFTPVAASDHVLVSLDRMQGIVSVDPAAHTATVWAGTKLRQLGELLHTEGLAQENMGDIDVQSIAGAISTGTHGTGASVGTIATQVTGIKVVNGLGEVLTCTVDTHPERFKALQISLGTLGIIVQVTLRLRPSYVLAYESKRMALADCLLQLPALRRENRHFEFFWFPYADTCQVKLMNEGIAPTPTNKLRDYIKDHLLENTTLKVLSELCRLLPAATSAVSRLSASAVPVGSKADYSYRIFATERLVRFHEMEYNVPAEAMADVVREMREAMERERFRVHFPIECRYVAADDIWLSPSYGRDSAYIAVHMYRGMPYERYFEVMEQIFLRYEGRPHWGKMHSLAASQLKERYPMWEQYARIREQMDPQELFLSPYMRQLLVTEGDDVL